MVKKVVFTSGAPGSGKSFLAAKLAKENNGKVFTTDDFFMVNGEYKWDGSYISAAHKWNFGEFAKAMFNGEQFLIVANTNLKAWEMMPYVELAVAHGYEFEIVEPKTKWAKDAEECSKRNTHGVPLATIERMLAEKQPIKDMDAELRRKFLKGAA